MKASHRRRFVVGAALGAAAALWLMHGFVADARKAVARGAQQRRVVVAAMAVASEPAKLAQWQAGTPDVEQARWIRGMQLEASTVAGEKAPRRLVRDEKSLYDRAQRLASAVQTNKDEGARKPEVELEYVEGGRLSVATPTAEGGIVELVTKPLPPLPETGWGAFALAFAVAVVIAAGAALALGERRALLAVACSVGLLAPIIVLSEREVALVAQERRAAAESVGARVREQAALVPAGSPASWDVSEFRQPRGEVLADGSVVAAKVDASAGRLGFEVRRALLSALALGFALLLLSGFGVLSRIGGSLKKHRQAYLYIAPAIIGMLVLVFYPFSYGITLSFTDSNLYNTNKSVADLWIGLRNYQDILGDFAIAKRAADGGFVVNYLNFYWTFVFTVIWTVTNVTLGVTSGLILALILNTRDLAAKPIYRVLLILPWALPNYITALIWKGMFHQQFGVINHALRMIGLPSLNWFDRPFTSFLTALATNGWLSFPFMMVVSLGALQSIPADLYEAARVDGASKWQQFKAITLPSLRPALVPAVILSVVWTFNMFNIIYLVTAGEPQGATEILVTQAFKFAFERYRYGYAAAYSTVIFIILLVYGVFQNRVTRATEA